MSESNRSAATSFELYRRLLSYALVYWQVFTLAIIGMVIVAGASTAFPALMQQVPPHPHPRIRYVCIQTSYTWQRPLRHPSPAQFD